MILLLTYLIHNILCFDSLGRSPLHFAYFNEHVETARILLTRGASINKKDNLGSTVLHEVCNIIFELRGVDLC